MRRQFAKRFNCKNVHTVTRKRVGNDEFKRFGFQKDITGTNPPDLPIKLQINGDSKGTDNRNREGLTSDGQNRAHCLALWDTDIISKDFIEWDGNTYKIEKFSDGAEVGGEYVIFLEFDIVQIRKNDRV